MEGWHIAVLSDRNLFREGLVALLRAQGFAHVAQYGRGAALLDASTVRPPRLLVVDLGGVPEEPGALLREVRRRLPASTLLSLGTALQHAALDVEADARLELPQADAGALGRVVTLALRHEKRDGGGPPASAELLRQRRLFRSLTPRQRQVLVHLAAGVDNGRIAASLGISARAVKAHVTALLSLFQLHARAELAVLAALAGLRPPGAAAVRAGPRAVDFDPSHGRP